MHRGSRPRLGGTGGRSDRRGVDHRGVPGPGGPRDPIPGQGTDGLTILIEDCFNIVHGDEGILAEEIPVVYLLAKRTVPAELPAGDTKVCEEVGDCRIIEVTEEDAESQRMYLEEWLELAALDFYYEIEDARAGALEGSPADDGLGRRGEPAGRRRTVRAQ